jgi:hypothetical protein
MLNASSRKTWLPILCVLSFVTWIVYILAQKGQATETYPLISASPQNPENFPYPLETVKQGNFYTHTITLAHEHIPFPHSITLLIATYGEARRIQSSQIKSTDGQCVWRLPSHQAIQDNSLNEWKVASCEPDIGTQLTLEIVTEDPKPFALWTLKESKDTSSTQLYVLAPEHLTTPARYSPYGHYSLITKNPSLSRAELLAFLWQFPGGSPSIWVIAIFCSFLFAVSLMRFIQSPHSRLTSITVVLTWMGGGALYCLLVPPFQAPDEPDHALAYAAAFHDENLAGQFLSLANRSHLERIKFRPDQKFNSTSMESPLKGGWADHISPPAYNARSPLALTIWESFRAIQLALNKIPIEPLLTLRFLNLFIVGLCLLFAYCLTYDQKIVRFQTLLFFSIPTLPFFAMHVSNYFAAIGLFSILSYLVAASLSSTRLSIPFFLALGLVAGLSPFASATSRGLVAFWLFFLPLLAIDQDSDSKIKRILNVLVKTLSFSIPMLLCLYFYDKTLIGIGFSQLKVLWQSPKELSNLGYTAQILASSVALCFLLIPMGLVFKEIVYLNRRIKSRVSPWIILIATFLIAWIGLWYHSLTTLDFKLPNIEQGLSLSQFAYAAKATALLLTNLLPSSVDFYVSSSFWMGFGWLEFTPGDIRVGLLRLVLGVGLFISAIMLVMTQEDEAFQIRFCAIIAGVLLMTFGLAFNCAQTLVNLHGRYLIPSYLLLLPLGSFGWMKLFDSVHKLNFFRDQEAHSLLKTALVCFVLIVHGYSLSHVLQRYF